MILGITLGILLTIIFLVVLGAAAARSRAYREAAIEEEVRLAKYRLDRIAGAAFQAMFDEARRQQGPKV
jgi:hypothetical protein